MRLYTGWIPASAWPGYCEHGLHSNCALRYHEDDLKLMSHLGCFVPEFYDSVCPRELREGRPENTFRVIFFWKEEYSIIGLMDDDDSDFCLEKQGVSQEELINIWQYVCGLAILNPHELTEKYIQLGWKRT